MATAKTNTKRAPKTSITKTPETKTVVIVEPVKVLTLEEEVALLKEQIKDLKFAINLRAPTQHSHTFAEVDELDSSFKHLLEKVEFKDHHHHPEDIEHLADVVTLLVTNALAEMPSTKPATEMNVPTTDQIVDIVMKRLPSITNIAPPQVIQQTVNSTIPYIEVFNGPTGSPGYTNYSVKIVNDSGYCVCNTRVVVSVRLIGSSEYSECESRAVTDQIQQYAIRDERCESIIFKLVDKNNPSLNSSKTLRIG